MANPASELSVPVTDLTGLTDRRSLARFISDEVKRDAPSRLSYLSSSLVNIMTMKSPAAQLELTAKHASDSYAHNRKVKEFFSLVDRFTVLRPVISLNDKEKALLRANAYFVSQHQIDPEVWGQFLAKMVWNEGDCRLEPDSSIASSPALHTTHDLIRTFVSEWCSEHKVFLASATQHVAQRQKSVAAPTGSPAQAMLQQAIETGARWMDLSDLKTSRYYTLVEKPENLVLGYEGVTGTPVLYAGAESLVTIGGPGSGKSQCQVIPNLLRYKGSAIVLDVKGELWEATAGYRAKHFGKVYRFAPTGASPQTHRYNPFDFISSDPAAAADQATVLTYQVVVENPNLKDPYWENRGRDLMWAYALMIALKAPPASRNMKGLAELMNVPFSQNPVSDIQLFLDSMQRNGARHGIYDLEAVAGAMRAGIEVGGSRLDSVMDAGRRYLSIFARSSSIAASTATSDWRPEYFRSRPGTTLYICVPPSELKAYAPLIRIMLVQHARILMQKQAAPGELPITFFLDEMPQLGNFESILELQDVGRGSGLRLWMFAQYIAQLETAFGNKYKGVVDACRVRSFLQPDMQLVELIQPGLGMTKNHFTGEQKKLAEDHELVGRAYDDKTIVTTRGDHPMALDKVYSYQSERHKFLAPPPVP